MAAKGESGAAKQKQCTRQRCGWIESCCPQNDGGKNVYNKTSFMG